MEIRTLQERPALTVRTTTSAADLPKTIGEAYGAIMAHLGKAGGMPSGYPFVVYYNMDMERLDVEIGFPVAHGTNGNGTVRASKVPGGKVATALHTGSYETLAKTYDELTAFVKEKGLETEAWMWESYRNSPQDTPPEKLQTDIFFPLKG